MATHHDFFAGTVSLMLYLASRSPRRQQLLAQLGVEFRVIDVDIEEVRVPGEPPQDYVNRVAREKAGAGLLQVMTLPQACVLGADTEVILDDHVFGKPADAAEAGRMLSRLSGATHEVITTVWCVNAGFEQSAVSRSEVTFAPLSPADIAAYVASGEPFGKAGGYAIQGYAATFISQLVGSYSGVMGLPLHETAQLLRCSGVTVAPPVAPG